MIFNPSREDARGFYFETWRKYQQQLPLSGAELNALAIMHEHPEYHDLFARAEQYAAQDYPPELGEANPFLHLSLHLAIGEQLAIDQPAGIRNYYQRLLVQHGTGSAAQHQMMDCLGEMIWQAQRNRTDFDPAVYLACLDKKVAGPGAC